MRIGIDLGGTKIEAIALGIDGAQLARERIPTPVGNYLATLDAVTGLVHHLEIATGQVGSVGIGIPGTISPTSGLIKNANSTCLIGHPLDKDLEARLNRPVRLANDADCFAVSEAVDGAAAGARSVFGAILGTGVGGGIVTTHGSPLAGPNAIAGEWGHNPLPWPQIWPTGDERPGPRCYCGLHGCIETFLSGPGLACDHAHTGFSAEMVVEAATAGDPTAEATLARYEHRLARSLATVINILDPEVIVLGGGLSNIERLYSNIPRIWNAWVFSDVTVTRLVKNFHGDSSGVRGAAWLWHD